MPRLARPGTAARPDRSAPPTVPESARGLVALRLGIGAVWALNLLFIVTPANNFFGGFSSTAQSYAPTTLGGPAAAEFVAAHPALFSSVIAATTIYLAVAFLLGLTTRVATLVGTGFALALLLTQFGSTFMVPGGTDVGPMPIYIAVYAALFAGHAERWFSLDAWWANRRTARTGAGAVGRAGAPTV